jgi:hypothetical protein
MRNDDDMVIRGSEENRPTVQKVVAKSEVCCLSNSRSRLVSGWKSRPVRLVVLMAVREDTVAFWLVTSCSINITE